MTTSTNLRLLSTVEDYLRITGTAPEALGLAAINDAGIVSRMRYGSFAGPCDLLLDRMIDHLEELTAASVHDAHLADLFAEFATIDIGLLIGVLSKVDAALRDAGVAITLPTPSACLGQVVEVARSTRA